MKKYFENKTGYIDLVCEKDNDDLLAIRATDNLQGREIMQVLSIQQVNMLVEGLQRYQKDHRNNTLFRLAERIKVAIAADVHAHIDKTECESLLDYLQQYTHSHVRS